MEIRPDTLHADTQGQSETVFGLAYLLAIQLMPRIRNWKDLTLYAPTQRFVTEQVEHLRELFSDTAAWGLIRTHLPDMLRVAISISQGKIRSSTILRKLGTESRKNRLYVAFRELGRVVRTIFLLQLSMMRGCVGPSRPQRIRSKRGISSCSGWPLVGKA